MSYSLVVPNGGPDESLLRHAGAELSKLGEKDAPGWTAWRARPARGVFVYEEPAGDAKYSDETAPKPPPGYEGNFLFTPEEIER